MAVVLNLAPVGIEVLTPCMLSALILLFLLGIPFAAACLVSRASGEGVKKRVKTKSSRNWRSTVVFFTLGFLSIIGAAYAIFGVMELPSAITRVRVDWMEYWGTILFLRSLVDFGEFVLVPCGLLVGGVALAIFGIYALYRRLKK